MNNQTTLSGETNAPMVEVVHSTQEKGALNNPPCKPRLITDEVIKAVSETLSALEIALTQERLTTINIGGLLAKLKGEIAIHLRDSGKTVSDKRIKGAFFSFVQMRFKIKTSRLNEYMRLAERIELHNLDLSVSVLIELSRLNGILLAKFLEEHPTEKLKGLTVKAIKKLVRETNENRRNHEPVSQKDLADSLRTIFDKVVAQVGDGDELDKDLDSVIIDIHFWYQSRKRVA